MARVAQIGAAETNATYNRALTKTHVPVKLADASPEGFELGEEPKPIMATMLKVDLQLSGASHCVANQCAMWRWADKPHPQDGIDRSHQSRHGFCGLAPIHQPT